MNSLRARFGQRVRELRRKRGWTQETLAAKAGKHSTYIGGIERGERNPTLEVVEDLAAALNIPVAQFFTFSRRRGNASSS